MRTPMWWSASPEGLPFDRRGKPPSGQTGRRLFRALPPAGRNALPRRACCPLATGNSDRARRAFAGPRVRRPHPSRRTIARGPDVTEAGREAADEAARPVRLFEEIRDALLLGMTDARPFLLCQRPLCHRHRPAMTDEVWPKLWTAIRSCHRAWQKKNVSRWVGRAGSWVASGARLMCVH